MMEKSTVILPIEHSIIDVEGNACAHPNSPCKWAALPRDGQILSIEYFPEKERPDTLTVNGKRVDYFPFDFKAGDYMHDGQTLREKPVIVTLEFEYEGDE